eukprot:SAG22_NODE_8894_length_623_cov_0.967557_2_plen_48_part_01
MAAGPAAADLSCMDSEYDGKGVMVTGVTGFVGKVVLEKLVHEFPSIKQ